MGGASGCDTSCVRASVTVEGIQGSICLLVAGVDPSVKVVYKPVSRFREETGLISKTVVYKYKQVTEILNTRREPAVITFTDQIPKSEDEKLKVSGVQHYPAVSSDALSNACKS